MNDKLIMENYLLVLKSTVEVYVHGTLESSNNSTKKILKSSLDDTMIHQKDTYDLMTEYGWYTIENISAKEICKTLSKITNQQR